MATAFLAGAFLATAFLATAFLAGVFLAGAAPAGAAAADVRLVGACPAGAFPAAALPAPLSRPAAPSAVSFVTFLTFLTAALVFSTAAFVPPAAFSTAPFTARPAEPPCADFFPLTSLAAPPEAPLGPPDADCCTAVFFATMAAAPSHIVILLANRAGTINRLESHGNGAHRPIRPPRARRAANLHPLCPAPRPVIRRAGRPRIRTPIPLHSGHQTHKPPLMGPAPPPPRKAVGRCPPGAVHWAERKAWMGTSSGVRSPERPGDGGSPGASAT